MQTCLYVRQLNWLSSRLLEDVRLNEAMKTVSDFRIVSIFPVGIPLCFHAGVFFLLVFSSFFFPSKCTEDPDPVELLSAVH